MTTPKNKSFLLNSPRESSPLSRSVSVSSMLKYNSNFQYSQQESRGIDSQRNTPRSEELAIELERLQHYKLNVPENDDETIKLQTEKSSVYYGTRHKRSYRLDKLLPYKTESIRDQYKYLSHIVAHLYIAIKSLDLKGNLSISVTDLEKAKKTLLNEEITNDLDNTHDEETYEDLGQTESEPDEEEEEEDDFGEDESSDDDSEFISTPAAKVELKSATIINIKYWTKELKNLLNMGLVIPIHLTQSLIKVYYAVALSRGQNPDISFYTEIVSLLLKEKELLIESGLKLDWKPFYDEFASTMAYPLAPDHMSDKHRFKKLIKFAARVSCFYEDDCLPHLMEQIMSRYSNQTVDPSFLQMAVTLPMIIKEPIVSSDGNVTYQNTDIRYYLPLFFSLWTSQRSNKEIACLLNIITQIADRNLHAMSKDPEMSKMGKFGIFTEDQFKLFINQLVMSSKMPKKDDKNDQYIKLLVEVIVNSMTSEFGLAKGGVMDLLKTFTKSVHTLVHPSNSGNWSNLLSHVVKRLAIAYHIRLLEESEDKSLVHRDSDDFSSLPSNVKLSPELTNEYLEALYPLIHLGLQAKSGTHRGRYMTALQICSFIDPKKMLDDILLDIYTSFESVNSTHRIKVVLNELTSLARYMAMLPVYRVHIPRLLSMLIPGIDPNDPEKTILTVQYVKTVAALVPFADLNHEEAGDGGLLAMDFTSQHLSYLEAKFYKSSPNAESMSIYGNDVPESFEYDKDIELAALASASSSFEEFVKQYCEGCFKCLENSPSIENDGGIESKASVYISNGFDSLIESLSDELFEVLADCFYEYITSNVKHLVVFVFSNIAELIVRRDPKKQFSRFYNYLLPQVINEIDEGAGNSRTLEVLDKDAKLIWHYKLFCGACLGAGDELLRYLPDLKGFILGKGSTLKGEAAYTTSVLINSIFGTMTCTRLMERRLISEDWLSKNGGKINEECWGGFQFDKYRFDYSNLQFNWYQPSAIDVEKTVDLFESVSAQSLEEIQQFIDSFVPNSEIPLEVSDRIEIHLNILNGSLSGICTLFDPNFNSDMLGLGFLRSGIIPDSTAMSSTATLEETLNPSVPTVELEESQLDTSLKALESERREESSGSELNDRNAIIDSDDDVAMVDGGFEQEISTENGIGMNISYGGSVPMSEVASGLATPALGNGLTAVNAALTNRSAGLYSFGYFYDRNSFANHADPTYLKLHKTRERIGRTLHDLATCLKKQDGAIELVSNLIGCIGIWLKNVGYFSSNNPIYYDNIHMTSLQDIPNTDSLITRTIIGARMAVYHCNRMTMSRSARLPNHLDKLLIKHLVSLSASSYKATSFQATSTLSSTLSKVLNSTNHVFAILKDWETALINKDHDKLKNILRLFCLKRFRGLAEKSNTHITKYEELIAQSVVIDDVEVNALALKLYSSIKKFVKVPSDVCLLNHDLIEAIRPPDNNVDFQIKTVKLAKENKKKRLFDLMKKVEKLGLKRSEGKLHWRFFMIVLDLLADLQSHLESTLNVEIITLLAKCVNDVHPSISKHCVPWLAAIMEAMELKGHFNYDLSDIMSVYPSRPDVSTIGSIIGDNRSDVFFEEMNNFKNPTFFVDSKIWVPTLCWNNNLRVMNTFVFDKMGFNEQDTKSMRAFGEFVSKDWLHKYLALHVDESESNSAFLPGLIYFMNSIIGLHMYGFTPNLEYDDLFEIIEKLYTKDEKQSHIATSEVMCAMVLAAKTNPMYIGKTDDWISQKLKVIFDDEVTQSTQNVWQIFCWWLPSHIDLRRFPKIVGVICDSAAAASDNSSPFIVATKLRFLKAYISSEINRFHDFDGIIERCFETLSHPYQVVADESAALLFECMLYTSGVSFESFDQLMTVNNSSIDGMGMNPYKLSDKFQECLVKYLRNMDALKPNIGELTAQQLTETKYMYAVRGLHAFLVNTLKTAHGTLLVPYIGEYIIPHLFELDALKDTCQLLNLSPLIQLYLIATIRYTREQTPVIIDSICNDHGLKSPTLFQTSHMITFAHAYYTVRYLTITSEQRLRLVKKCSSFLYSQHLDVREQASTTFSIIIHSYISSSSEKLIKRYIKEFTKILNSHKRVNGVKLTLGQLNELHGATLGLGALVDAFPYTSPPPSWLPGVLSLLARKCTAYDGVIGRTAKDTLSKFKKTRQDTWHIDSKFFAEDQLDDLEGVLWKSYFI